MTSSDHPAPNLLLPASARRLGLIEFTALVAFLASLSALAIDIVLPVTGEMGKQLGSRSINDTQWIISMVYLGLASGQILFGPISDQVGRRAPIVIGLLVFMLGCALSAAAQSMETMLLGRFMQGFGVAGPRIVGISMVRDLYVGREMAQISSIALGMFILVPALAPALGQGIVAISSWMMIFFYMIAQAAVMALWFLLRQPETLRPEYRRPVRPRVLWDGLVEICQTRVSFYYSIAAGIIFGAFSSYIFTAPQLFADLWGITDKFPIYFGVLSVMIGLSSIFNAALVKRVGMRRLCQLANVSLAVNAAGFLLISLNHSGILPLQYFLIWAGIAFFTMGFLFGNFNALAMEPLGHLAGIGAAFVGSFSMLISFIVGMAIAQAYNQTALPLIGGFVILALISFVIMRWADAPQDKPLQTP